MSAFVGLDVHSEHTFATVLDHSGRVVAQRRMVNEHVSNFLRLFNVVRVGLEASTHVAPIYRALVGEGYRVQVSHPKKTRYIAEARIKSDMVDSKAIAELVRLDALPPSYMPPPEIAELREKVRRRAFLVRERAKLMTKIRGVLAYEGDQLRRLAGDDEDVELLVTIPGVGYYTALLVKAEIRDVNRFRTGAQLCGYAGIVPSTHSSGGVTRHGPITKEGSRWLRWPWLRLR